MDPQTYDRWLEVSFYYFCQDILSVNNDIMDIMGIVEALAPMGKYEAETLKSIVQDVLMTYRIRPTREEFALLCIKNGVTFKELNSYLRISNRTLYQLIADNEADPRVFYPRLDVHKLALIKKFLDTIKILRKAGI